MTKRTSRIDLSGGWLTIFLCVLTIIIAILAWVLQHRFYVSQIESRYYNSAGMEALQTLLTAALYMLLATRILTLVFLIIFVYQSHSNLDKLNVHNLKFSHGWAVAYFFIPFLNLVRVPQVLGEIWKASGIQNQIAEGYTSYKDIPSIVIWWWFFVVTSPVLAMVPQALFVAGEIPYLSALSLRYSVVIVPWVFTVVLVAALRQRQLRREDMIAIASRKLG